MLFYTRKGKRTLIGKLFIDRNGDLKPALVGIVSVLVAFAVIAVVVQFKEPVEKVAVKITHRFKATASQKIEPENSLPVKAYSEDKKAQSPEAGDSLEKQKPTNQEIRPYVKLDMANTSTEKDEDQGLLAKPIGLMAEEEFHKDTLDEARLGEQIKQRPEEVPHIKSEAKEIKEQVHLNLDKEDDLSNNFNKDLERSELKPDDAEQTKDAEEQQAEHEIQEAFVLKAVKTLGPKKERAAEDVRFNQTADDTKKEIRESVKDESVLQKVARMATFGKRLDSIRIAPDDYKRLYGERFSYGSKSPSNLYRWRVSNQYGASLRDCYMLFDMKAVAVTANNKYYDLKDLTPLTEDYLSRRFSSTIIICDNPERDFGAKIQKLPTQKEGVSVRYYMYKHIRNYFYNRVEQAVGCCIGGQSIPSDMDIREHIDVIGRVFKIEKDNGQFGVFVPTRVYYQNSELKKEINLPGSCFADDTDVKILRSKGLLSP